MPKSILGFDVGGTKISAVAGNDSGEIIANLRRPTIKHLGKKRLVQQLVEMGNEVMEKAGFDVVDSIGILFAGLVDQKNGVVISSPNIPGLNNFNLASEIKSHFGAPVTLENDATGAAIAERLFGSGTDVENFVYVTLSTGIGGGIFINGKLYRGSHGLAGELGHMVIMSNGPTCGCGRKGCLEAIAGGKGIARRVSENISAVRESQLFSTMRPNDIDAQAVFEAKKHSDMFAQLIIEETVYYLAVGIVNIVNILDPELIIIGGGISRAGNDLFHPLRLAVKEEMRSLARKVKIVRALENGSDLAAIAVPLFKYE
ncbi:MAG: ROK family protein [Thermoplasmataceae archaeon]